MGFGFNLDPFKDSWNDNNRPLKWPARVLGLACALLLIVAESLDQGWLNPWSKTLFLSGGVLLSVAVLNRDLKHFRSAWLLLLCLVAIHVSFVQLLWTHLRGWSFIVLTPLAFVEALALNMPVFLFRKWKRREYPTSVGAEGTSAEYE